MGSGYVIRRRTWREDADALEGDLGEFRAYFIRHKKCGCEMNACRHYRRALARAFGPRLDRIYYARLYEGLRMCYDAVEEAGRRP